MSLSSGNQTGLTAQTAGNQEDAVIRARPGGGWVAVWTDAEGANGKGVFARIFDASGNGGTAFQVNATLPLNQFNPVVDVRADGSMVFAWSGIAAGGNSVAYARRYDVNGNAGPEIAIAPAQGLLNETEPVVAALADGGFVLARTVVMPSGGSRIFATRYDANGVAVTTNQWISTPVNAGQPDLSANRGMPAIRQMADGKIVFSWVYMSDSFIGNEHVEQRLFDSNLNPLGNSSEIAVFSNGTPTPSIIPLAGGGWLTAWYADTVTNYPVQFRRFDANGNALDAAPINVATTGISKNAFAVTQLTNGDLVVVWESSFGDGSGNGVYQQLFSASGVAKSGVLLVNQVTAGDQKLPSVTAVGTNGWVVSWQTPGGGGDTDLVQRTFQYLNDAPTSANLTKSTNEDVTLAFAAADFTFADTNGDSFAGIVIMGINAPGKLMLGATEIKVGDTVSAANLGNLTFVPNQEANNVTFGGPATISFKVKDSGGTPGTDTSATHIATININPVNDAPKISGSLTSLVNGTEDISYTITKTQLLTGISDPESNPMSITSVTSNGGSWAKNADDSWTFTPNQNFNGLVSISYTVTDGSATLNVANSFSLAAVNDAPQTPNTIPLQQATLGQAFTFDALNLNGDPAKPLFTDPEGSALTFSLTRSNGAPPPAWLKIDAATGLITGTPGNADIADLSLVVKASDGINVTASSFTLKVGLNTAEQEATPAGIAGSQAPKWTAGLTGGGWVSVYLDDTDVKMQRYEADGDPLGSATTLSNAAFGARAASVTALANGGWAVVWSQEDSGGSPQLVRMQIFSANGVGGTVIKVNIPAQGATPQSDPSITQLANGNLLVTWVVEGTGPTDWDIYQRMYNSIGTPRTIDGTATPQKVNTQAEDLFQYDPVVRALSDGGWVTAWSSDESATIDAIRMRVSNADGTIRAEQIISPPSEFDNDGNYISVGQPDIAALKDGGYVATWRTSSLDLSVFPPVLIDADIYLQRYDANGNAVGNRQIVNQGPVFGSNNTAGNQTAPAIAALATGGWVVVWQSDSGDDGEALTILQQVYRADGTKLGAETVVNEIPNGDQSEPTVAALADGGWVVSWKSTASDVDGDIAQRTYHLVNNSPTSSNQNRTVTGGNTYVFSASDFPINDPDGDGLGAVTITAISGDGTLTYNGATVTFPLRILTTDLGKLVYTASGNANPLGANLTFRVEDDGAVSLGVPTADTASRTFTFAVTAPNQTPALTGLKATLANGTEDNTYTISKADLLAGITDAESNPLTVTALTSNGGSWAKNADDSWTFTPTKNFNGQVDISYAVSDGNSALTVTNSFSLAAINDAPELAGAKASLANGAYNQPYTITEAQFLSGISDAEGSAMSVTAVTSNGGSWTKTANNSWTFTPNANFSGVVNLNFSVTDGSLTATGFTNSFSVNPANQPPALTGNKAVLTTGTEDNSYTITKTQLLTGINDPESNPLTITNVTSNGGTWTEQPNGDWKFTPNQNFNGTVNLNYSVTDGSGALAVTNSFTMTGTNDAPAITSALTSFGPIAKNQPLTVTKAQLLQGITDADGDQLTVSNLTSTGGTWANNGNDTWTFTPNGVFSGQTNLSYQVSDGIETINVLNPFVVNSANNSSPVSNPITIPDQVAIPGQGYSFNARYLDGDPAKPLFTDPDGDTLTYSLKHFSGAPAPAWLEIDPITGIITGTPGNADIADLFLVVFASDGINVPVAGNSFTLKVGLNTVEQEATPAGTALGQAPKWTAGLTGGGWVSVYLDDTDVKMQRYEADGDPLGSATTLSNAPAFGARAASVTALANGGWAVVWSQEESGNPPQLVRMQIFDANGVGGTVIRVNANVQGVTPQSDPSVTQLANGNLLVTWVVEGTGPTGPDIYQRMYNSIGTLRPINGTTAPQKVNTQAEDNYQYDPVVRALADGGWVTAWSSDESATIDAIRMRISNSDGTVRAEQIISPPSEFDSDGNYISVGQPDIAALKDGGYVATWRTSSLDLSVFPPVLLDADIYLQRYDANGNTIGNRQIVNQGPTFGFNVTAENQTAPAIAALATGGWVIVWQSANVEDGDALTILQQVYRADGTKLGAETVVNDIPYGDQSEPTVAALADGGWVVNWKSNAFDADGDIYQRTYHLSNIAPKGSDQSRPMTGGTTYTFDASDFPITDTENDGLGAVTITAISGDGTLTYNGTPVTFPLRILTADLGKLVYTASGNANPLGANLTFRVEDDGAGSLGVPTADTASRTFTFAVTAPNQPPTLTSNAGFADSDEDVPRNFTLADFIGVANDPNGDPLSVTALSSNHGTFASTGNGTWTFTPTKDYNGPVTVTYTLSDGKNGTLNVTRAFNLLPVDDDSTITGVATGSVTEDVSNKTTTTGDLDVTDPDTTSATFTIVDPTKLDGKYGTFSFNVNDGTWSYTLANNDPDTQALGKDVTDKDKLLVRSSDGTAEQWIEVTITGTNDAPEAKGPVTALPDGKEDVDLEIDPATILGDYKDVDIGDVLSLTGLSASNGASVAIVNGKIVISPAAGYSGPLTLSFTVTDGKGGALAGTRDVTIKPAATDATIEGVSTDTVVEDSAANTVTHTLDVIDPDANEDGFKTVTLAEKTGVYGDFEFNETSGQWSYKLDNTRAATTKLTEGDTVYETLTVWSIDGKASREIKVTVKGANDQSTISGTASKDLTETNAALTTGGTLTATDVDSTAGFKTLTNVAGSSGYGKFSIATDGTWTYVMNSAHDAFVDGTEYTDTILVETLDGQTRTLSVKITGTDDKSTISGTASKTLTEANAALTTGGKLTAADVDSTAGFKTQTDVAGSNGHGTFSILADGTWTYVMNSAHDEFVAGTDYTDTIEVETLDGVKTTLSVTITGTDDKSTISGTTSKDLTETNAALTTGGTLTANDVDSTAGFKTQTNVGGSGGYGKFSIASDGTWTYVMNSAHDAFVAGTEYTDTILVETLDGQTRTLSVKITGTDDKSTISGTASKTLTEANAALTTGGKLAAADVDNAPGFKTQTNVVGSNGHGTFSILADGTWTYVMNSAHDEFVAGTDYTDTIEVETLDGVKTTLSVTITGTDDKSTISGTTSKDLTETNAALTTGGTLTANDVDSTAGFKTQTNVGGSGGYGKFSIASDGTWTYVMNSAHDAFVAGTEYTDTILVETLDGQTRTLSVKITGTDDESTISGTASKTLTEANAALTTGGTLTATDVDSTAGFKTQTNVVGSNGHGTFSILADGTWTYVMNSAHDEFVAGTDYTDTIEVETLDGVKTTLSVTITGTNDTPIAKPGPVTALPAGTEDQTLQVDIATILSDFLDVDGDTLSLINPTINNGATVANAGNGKLVITPAADYFGNLKLDFTISDGKGGTVAGNRTLTINPTSDTPTITGPLTGDVTEDLPGIGNKTGGDLDISDKDPNQNSFQPVAAQALDGTYGIFKFDAATGIWSYELKNDRPATQALKGGQFEEDRLDVTSLDGTVTKTITVKVHGVNDAPTSADKTLSILEDQPYTFKPTDFAFADTDGNALAFVRIETLTGNGTLTLGSTKVTAGQLIAADQLGNLVWTPDANVNSGKATPQQAGFTYRVIDNGGTADNGQNASVDASRIGFDIAPVNDRPTGLSSTITVTEDARRAFSAADFRFADPNGDKLAAVLVDSFSGNGQFLFEGKTLAAGQLIKAADIGKLVYLNELNHSGASQASLVVRLQDDGGTANAGLNQSLPVTINLDVSAVIDRFYGTRRANHVTGTDEGDWLSGMLGRDLLTGGDGADVFYFRPRFGRDTITDFETQGPSHDVIDITRVPAITDFDDLMANHVKARGEDVLIRIGKGDTIVLQQVDLAELGDSHFLI